MVLIVITAKINYRNHPIASAIQILYIVLTNSNTVKLTYLLAQFLYTKKQLNLPGLGSFFLDPSIEINSENHKQQPVPDGISFRNDPTVSDVSELIAYISGETGKMKALATADLDSQIQLALQFLNMGKPYTFEGIGTLTKARSAEFEFTPGAIIPEKLKETGVRDKQPVTSKDTVDAKYQTYLSEPEVRPRWRKPVVALLVITGIAVTIWAGYTISNRNPSDRNSEEDIQPLTASLVNDSSVTEDSTVAYPPPAKDYKYVLEVARSKRAFKRYNQLKDNRWDVHLETDDSIQYKLFLILPITADTSRVLDSLMVMTGRKVYIEYPR